MSSLRRSERERERRGKTDKPIQIDVDRHSAERRDEHWRSKVLLRRSAVERYFVSDRWRNSLVDSPMENDRPSEIDLECREDVDDVDRNGKWRMSASDGEEKPKEMCFSFQKNPDRTC